MGIGSHMPRTMEETMSPRLDEPRTHNATSACPQGLTESDSPAAAVLDGTRNSTTSSGSDTSSTEDDHGVTDGLEGLPEIPPYAEVGPLDARALSKTLFARLESLEEGTYEYSYVRNTLVELNLALVKFAASRFRSRSSRWRTSSRSAPSA